MKSGSRYTKYPVWCKIHHVIDATSSIVGHLNIKHTKFTYCGVPNLRDFFGLCPFSFVLPSSSSRLALHHVGTEKENKIGRR